LSPVPDIDEMTGQAAGDEEQRIDPDYVAIAGKAGREAFSGDCDATQAVFVERHRRRFDAIALLDLDEGDGFPPPDDQIDFAAGDTGAPSENPPASQPQPPGSERFRPAATRLGQLPVQSPPPSSRARP
jgi:hypothetical protein